MNWPDFEIKRSKVKVTARTNITRKALFDFEVHEFKACNLSTESMPVDTVLRRGSSGYLSVCNPLWLTVLRRCVRLAEAAVYISVVDRADVMEGLERKSRVSDGRRASRR